MRGAGFIALLAPVHLRAWRTASGGLQSCWVARGRAQGWDDPEPAMPMCLWRFRVAGETRIERASATGRAEVPAAELVALFGGPAPAGTVEVEALGPGPAVLRRSAPVAV